MADGTYAVEWRKIPHHSNYEVSTEGRIRRCTPNSKRNKPVPYELSLVVGPGGYLQVCIFDDRKGAFVTRKIHRMVLLAFSGEPPTQKHVAAHANGCRTDNRLINLRWATCKENHADARKHGTWPHGKKLPHSKLDQETVKRIRSLKLKRGDQTLIATVLGVSRAIICEALSGKSWAHVSHPAAKSAHPEPPST